MAGATGRFEEEALRRLMAYSVEKLLGDLRRGDFRGSPKAKGTTIVDPGPFYEVDVVARRLRTTAI
jgi:hypothetical protein